MGLVMHYYEGHKKENQVAAVLLASELKKKRGEMSIEEIISSRAYDVEPLSSEIRSIRGLYLVRVAVSENLPALKFGDLVAVEIIRAQEEYGPFGIFGIIWGLTDEQPFFDPHFGWQYRPFRMKPIPDRMRASPSKELVGLMKEAIIMGSREHLSLSEIKWRLVYQELDKTDPASLDFKKIMVDCKEMAFHSALGRVMDQSEAATEKKPRSFFKDLVRSCFGGKEDRHL